MSNQIYPKCPFCRVHLIDCIGEQEYREILLQIYFTGEFRSLKYYTHLKNVPTKTCNKDLSLIYV